MIFLNREIKLVDTYKNKFYQGKCQASFNSDGNITLRTYEDKEIDEIIIFSKEETNAIFNLMYKIHEKTHRNDLSF